MSEHIKYIGGKDRGIPESIFEQDFLGGSVKTLSGRYLHCEVSPRMIRVSTKPGFEHIVFYAAVDQSGTMRMTIKTRNPETHEIVSPDVYAQQLLKRFYQHTVDQGVNVKKIKGEWGRTSVNYKMFKEYIAALGEPRDITPSDEIDAANQTWTGTVANSLGFGKARILNDWRKQYKICVDFYKGHPLPFENL